METEPGFFVVNSMGYVSRCIRKEESHIPTIHRVPIPTSILVPQQ
jgi:hypothetical protein